MYGRVILNMRRQQNIETSAIECNKSHRHSTKLSVVRRLAKQNFLYKNKQHLSVVGCFMFFFMAKEVATVGIGVVVFFIFTISCLNNVSKRAFWPAAYYTQLCAMTMAFVAFNS